MYDWCKECTREFRGQCDQDAENCEALAMEIKEYIKEQAKHLHTEWGDSETNAPDWISEFTQNEDSE